MEHILYWLEHHPDQQHGVVWRDYFLDLNLVLPTYTVMDLHSMNKRRDYLIRIMRE